MKGIHFLSIAAAHAFVFTLMLAFLKAFKFIKWHPLKWTERYYFFPMAPNYTKWILTFAFVLVFVMLAIGVFAVLRKMPAIFTSLAVGFLFWLLLEWVIYKDFSHIGWHSVPVLTAILLVVRALAETVVYYDKAVYDDERK